MATPQIPVRTLVIVLVATAAGSAAHRAVTAERAIPTVTRLAGVTAGGWDDRLHYSQRDSAEGVESRRRLLIYAPERMEAAVVDLDSGRTLGILGNLFLGSHPLFTAGGRYACVRGPAALLAIDLVVPQEATHLRRERPDVGVTDWMSGSRDGSVVVAAFSPTDDPAPRSVVVVYRGANLTEAASYRLPELFQAGYVTPDGQSAFVVALSPRSARRDLVRLQRLDLRNGQLTPLVEEMPAFSWLAFAPGAPFAFLLRSDHSVARLDLRTGELFPVDAGAVFDVATGPDPGQVLTGGSELLVWDAAASRPAVRYTLPFAADQVGTTADGAYLYAADRTRERLHVIHRADGRAREIRIPFGAVTDE